MQMLYLVSFETGFKLCDYFLDKKLKIVLFYSERQDFMFRWLH